MIGINTPIATTSVYEEITLSGADQKWFQTGENMNVVTVTVNGLSDEAETVSDAELVSTEADTLVNVVETPQQSGPTEGTFDRFIEVVFSMLGWEHEDDEPEEEDPTIILPATQVAGYITVTPPPQTSTQEDRTISFCNPDLYAYWLARKTAERWTIARIGRDHDSFDDVVHTLVRAWEDQLLQNNSVRLVIPPRIVCVTVILRGEDPIPDELADTIAIYTDDDFDAKVAGIRACINGTAVEMPESGEFSEHDEETREMVLDLHPTMMFPALNVPGRR